MKRVIAGLAVLVVLLAVGAWASDEKPRIPPPKLQDVRVWYYPPGQKKPVTVLWWQPEKLRIHRKVDVDRRGSLRIRILISGGFAEDEKGLLNWVSVVFRDDNTSLFDLPHELRETRNGIKDMYWRVPQVFATGPLEFEVLAWDGKTPKTSLLVGEADRTYWFNLGTVRGH